MAGSEGGGGKYPLHLPIGFANDWNQIGEHVLDNKILELIIINNFIWDTLGITLMT